MVVSSHPLIENRQELTYVELSRQLAWRPENSEPRQTNHRVIQTVGLTFVPFWTFSGDHNAADIISPSREKVSRTLGERISRASGESVGSQERAWTSASWGEREMGVFLDDGCGSSG
jgi:hypothetical protein